MTTLAQLAEAIGRAPRGPGTIACFDYDGTVIGGYSAEAFYAHRMRHLELGPLELVRTLLLSRGLDTEQDFAKLLGVSLAAWRGRDEAELEALGEQLFRGTIAARLHEEAWELIELHRACGHRLVLASSATRFQVEPMARELGFDHVLCTAVELRDGRLTGRPAGRPMWGPAKADALRALASEHGADLGASFAYTNGAEDAPLLTAVGHPVCVEPDPRLLESAAAGGWPVLRTTPRGGRPGLVDVARTAGVYAAFGAASWVGAGVGLLHRSRQTGIDVTLSVGSEVALAIAGIDVRVLRGSEHLWSSRPAVFVFNHQSYMDALVAMSLVRHGYTGVAKAQAKRIPVFGPLFMAAGVAFVERGDTQQAMRALEPAVRKLRDERLSLVISPEGTRSLTPRLGRFKKGAFHIAMQAGVPVVPIVMRGAGNRQRKSDHVIRPGAIEVVVLEPVDTSGWRPANAGRHAEEVRAMFERTLASWPTAPLALLPGGSPAEARERPGAEVAG